MTWADIPLAEFADVKSGGGAPQDAEAFSDDGHPFVRAGSLVKLLSGTPEDALEKIRPEMARIHGLKLFPKGTVLFAKSGMSATKGHIYALRDDAYVVNHLAALVPRETSDSAFLFHALQLFSPTTLIKDPAYPSIRLGDIEDMKIRAPHDVKERARIAQILDQADALRRKRRAVIDMLDNFELASFVNLFGPMEVHSTTWPLIPLADLVTDTLIGLVRSAAELGPHLTIPYVRMNAITRKGRLDLSELDFASASVSEQHRYRLEKGDFLFNTRNSRELVGKSAIFNADGLHIYNNNIMRIRFENGIHARYVAQAFRMPMMLNEIDLCKAGTTSVFAIYWKTLKNILVPVPPEPLQRQFAELSCKVEAQRSKLSEHLSGLEALFASLQHRAFRGEF